MATKVWAGATRSTVLRHTAATWMMLAGETDYHTAQAPVRPPSPSEPALAEESPVCSPWKPLRCWEHSCAAQSSTSEELVGIELGEGLTAGTLAAVPVLPLPARANPAQIRIKHAIT